MWRVGRASSVSSSVSASPKPLMNRRYRIHSRHTFTSQQINSSNNSLLDKTDCYGVYTQSLSSSSSSRKSKSCLSQGVCSSWNTTGSISSGLAHEKQNCRCVTNNSTRRQTHLFHRNYHPNQSSSRVSSRHVRVHASSTTPSQSSSQSPSPSQSQSQSPTSTNPNTNCFAATLSNLCVDIFHSVPDGYTDSLRKLSSSPGDPIANALSALRQRRDDVGVDMMELGGCANFAVAASRLGIETICVGVLGEDQLGQFMIDNLKEERIEFVDMLQEQETQISPQDGSNRVSTSTSDILGNIQTLECNVVVEDGKHSFFSGYDSGSPFGHMTITSDTTSDTTSQQHTPFKATESICYFEDGKLNYISESARQRLTRGCIFINGFTFDEINGGLIAEIARSCRERSMQSTTSLYDSNNNTCFSMFDGGPRLGKLLSNRAHKHHLNNLLQNVDIVLATEEEADILTGINSNNEHNNNSHNGDETLARIAKAELHCIHLFAKCQFASLIVIKMGPLGTVIGMRKKNTRIEYGSNNIEKEEELSKSETIRIHHCPGFAVHVADTVGCGDSLAAAVALGVMRQAEIETIGALANAVGAATAMRMGAGRNVATLESVTDILEKGFTTHTTSDSIEALNQACIDARHIIISNV